MPKVIVAMSGGVDSSVAAAILKNRGYDVVGVFMLMHKNSNPQDAKAVARKLKIDFKVLDVRKEFKKRVIDYFVKEYNSGNTPNPCVECNKHIKFKFLIDIATKLKADFITTGHYAKIKGSKLFIAKDTKKDQSYFLWQLNQKQLSKIIFPLGDYTKEQVGGLAKKFRLPVFGKKESQDICFTLPRRSPDKIGAKAGLIITIKGEKVGEHKGLSFYTIGQRKGLPATPASWLAWRAGNPVYVVKKDLKKNALIISKSEKDLLSKEIIVKDMNWLSDKPYNGKYKVKIRSTAKMADAKIKGNKITFTKSQRAITPGQSAVFYKNSEILGGGIIS